MEGAAGRRAGDIGVAGLALAGAWEFATLSAPALSAFVAASVAALSWRTTAPVLSPVVAGLSPTAVTVLRPDLWPATPILVLVVVCWVLGAADPERRRSSAAIAISIIAAFLVVRAPTLGTEALQVILLTSASWTAGLIVGRARRATTHLLSEADELERYRPYALQAAVADERVRIARELHDAVTSSVSAMTVQAGAARVLLDLDPARAREPVESAQQAGREALAELRRLAEVLGTSGAPTAPLPGLRDVEALVQRMRATGLVIELERHGTPVPLGDGAELAAYRIVQEALANVLEHVGRTRVRVVLRHTAHSLDLEIDNDPPTHPAGSDERVERRGTGHGIVGMHERAALYGGTVIAGPEGDGFRVSATIPVAQ